MLRKSTLTVILAGSLLLTACQTNNWGGGESVGTLGGAAAGGLIGNAIGGGGAGGTLLGVLIGGFAGNQLGGYVDDTDRQRASAAEQRAYTAPIGKQIAWNNPENGNSGIITPTRDGYDQNGAYCREFQQSIVVGGKKQQGYGKACQQPDGSWKIVQN
jgi:hypothetical protein